MSPRFDDQGWQARLDGLLGFIDAHQQWPRHGADGVEERRLACWVSAQRSRYHRGGLPGNRVAGLEAVPGWQWRLLRPRARPVRAGTDPQASWAARVDELRMFRVEHDRWPQRTAVDDGERRLAGWARRQIRRYRDGLLAVDRVAMLETVDGWRWSLRAAHPTVDDRRWNAAHTEVAAFRHAVGRYPRRSSSDPVEHGLGVWCATQRGRHTAGALSDERTVLMESLPGWEWVPVRLAGRWRQQYAETVAWIAINDGFGPRPESPDLFERRLARWLRQQAGRHRLGDLSVEQVALLGRLEVAAGPALFDPDRTREDLPARVARPRGSVRPAGGDEGAVDGRAIAELADEFEVGPTTMWRWARRPDFPASLGFRRNSVRRSGEARGLPAEVWDVGEVRAWRSARLTARHESSAVVEREQAASAALRQLEVDRVDAVIRRLRGDGLLLRSIAAVLDVPYGRVRRVTAGQLRPPSPPASRRQIWTDAEIVDALSACGPASAVGYNVWRAEQRVPRPSSATVIVRYGHWSYAQRYARSSTATD